MTQGFLCQGCPPTLGTCRGGEGPYPADMGAWAKSEPEAQKRCFCLIQSPKQARFLPRPVRQAGWFWWASQPGLGSVFTLSGAHAEVSGWPRSLPRCHLYVPDHCPWGDGRDRGPGFPFPGSPDVSLSRPAGLLACCALHTPS